MPRGPVSLTAPTPRRDADGWIALAALAVAVGCALGLDPSVRRPEVPPGVPRLATVRSTVSEVRRRAAGSMVWEAIGAGAALYPADSLFVPPEASATIDLEDGARVEIESSSLMVLPSAVRPLAPSPLTLEKGALVAAATGRGLSVALPGGTAQLEPDAAAALSVDDQGTEVAVLEGLTSVATGGATHALAPHSLSALQPDGRLETRVLPVVLVGPARAARTYFTGELPAVTFRWEAPDGGPLTLEVSRAHDFSERAVSRSASGGEATVQLGAPGAYFWRLVDGAGRVQSETRKLSLVRDLPPRLLSPREGEHLQDVVPFAWTRVDGVEQSLVEVAADAAFTQVVARQAVKGTSWRWIAPRRDAPYWWRVRSVDPERGEPPASSARAFDVVVTPLPEAPELYTPEVEVERRAQP